jgi:type IV pilus assembly protein PilV
VSDGAIMLNIRDFLSAQHAQHAQRGVTLLEVLIALVILSIGLLGLAGLQGLGIRSTHGANLTSQASVLAYDMADRIRANPDDTAAYTGFVTNCPNGIPNAPLSAADLAEWSCAVEALLPAGIGRITRVANGAVNSYTIEIEWRDTQVAEGEDPWNFVLNINI